MQQLAPCPSQQPPRPIPYGLVSLLDMMNFNLSALLYALILLRQEAAFAAFKAAREPNDRMSDADLERFRANLDGIAQVLNALFIAEGRLGRLATMARLGAQYVDVAHELAALDSDILDASATERFYHYPREKGLLVFRVPGDWLATLKAFPSAEKDVKAAVDCYALGHSHASIHHSMMVLERGLPTLAARLKVKFNPDKATWKDLTKGITDRITAERNLMSATPKGKKPPSRAAAKKKSNFLEACEEAVIEFRYFTSVWRNHVAHGRADYDENDAKKVLEHVRTFMEVITTKLKLKE